MEIIPLGIQGAWLASSKLHADSRGSFHEWFKFPEIKSVTGIDFDIAQANISESKRGVVRGIHYSLAAQGQMKWITCVNGAIKDVVADIRPDSSTYGKSISIDLRAGDGQMVFIEQGLGHGFAALSDETKVAYLVSSEFSPSDEFEINPLDPLLAINWGLPINEILLSSKDGSAPSLKEREASLKLPTLKAK